jgi:La domain
MSHNKAELKKQVEYYLSDKNLTLDKFFNEKLSEGKDGWMDLSFILNCNKIKNLKLKNGPADVAEAIKDSNEVEISEDHKQIRRKGAKPVPELAKKRDSKANDKEEKKEDKKQEEDKLPELDARGNPILANADFENPIIIHFKTGAADDFKVNWKEVETAVRTEFPRLKIVYSRADQHEGDLAISSHRLNSAELDKLSQATLKVQDRDFSFSKTTGEELKTFW